MMVGTVLRCAGGESACVDRTLPTLRFLSPELSGERHPAGTAAGAAHSDQDILLLLLVEVEAIEHRARLLLKQLMQRQVAGLALAWRRRLADRVGRRRRRE